MSSSTVDLTTVAVEYRSTAVRAHRGYVDGEGWARNEAGLPLPPGLRDGCGAFNASAPAPGWGTPDGALVETVAYPLLAVTSKWSYKYFHWLVEALPRVALLMQLEPTISTRAASVAAIGSVGPPRLLVSCKSPAVRESLALLGIEHRRIHCWKYGHTVRTSSYLLWPQASPCGGVQAHAAHLLRTAALPRDVRPVEDGQLAASGAVLLHRRLGKRKLTNHDAVHQALQAFLLSESSTRHGRTPLPGSAEAPTDRSSYTYKAALRAAGQRTSSALQTVDGTGTLRSQIEALRSARCQVGPHGAGLSLMIFAPSTFGTAEITPGAYFVRIRGKPGDHLNRNRNRTGRAIGSPSPNACFQGLAATLRMRHEWIVVAGATANENLTPDPQAVAQLARAVCPRPLDTAWAVVA